jgi:hypothetical protein
MVVTTIVIMVVVAAFLICPCVYWQAAMTRGMIVTKLNYTRATTSQRFLALNADHTIVRWGKDASKPDKVYAPALCVCVCVFVSPRRALARSSALQWLRASSVSGEREGGGETQREREWVCADVLRGIVLILLLQLELTLCDEAPACLFTHLLNHSLTHSLS